MSRYTYYENMSLKFTYDFGYQLITTFQASVAIVLAFQSNTLITKIVHKEYISSDYAIVIPVLILVSMTLSLLKNKYSSRQLPGFERIPAFHSMFEVSTPKY